MSERRVVITGIGILSGLGNDRESTWNGVVNGKSGVRPVTQIDVSKYPTRIASEVRDFDPLKFVTSKELHHLDRYSQIAIAAADEAWKDASLDQNNPYPQVRMGSIFGSGMGGFQTLEQGMKALLEGGYTKVSPYFIPRIISNSAPGNIAIRFQLRGVNYAVSSACASSTHALGDAYNMVRHGMQDVVLSGGSEASVTEIGCAGFCRMRAMSTRNEEPEKASRPFDKERDGFVMGEGAAVLVVENLESALSRGAKIYAEILGYSVSCDAFRLAAPPEDGVGAASCMRLALESAGIVPEAVQYINAHGSATVINDKVETKAIKEVFGKHAYKGLVVSSTKSMTGHLLGAAGGIEAAFSALALQRSIVPPTINLDSPDPECDLDYVPHTARELSIETAMSNSFGFGGTNASIILRRYA